MYLSRCLPAWFTYATENARRIGSFNRDNNNLYRRWACLCSGPECASLLHNLRIDACVCAGREREIGCICEPNVAINLWMLWTWQQLDERIMLCVLRVEPNANGGLVCSCQPSSRVCDAFHWINWNNEFSWALAAGEWDGCESDWDAIASVVFIKYTDGVQLSRHQVHLRLIWAAGIHQHSIGCRMEAEYT